MMNVFDLIKFNSSLNSNAQINKNGPNQSLKNKNETQSSHQQHSDLQSSPVTNIFKNNEMLKQQLLVSNFYQVLTGIQKQQLPQTKIVPTLLINKIQQSRPHYKNSVIFKQLAFDILLETDKTYKVKNCVSPARPNSQIYKRLSKNFFDNLKNGIDQCILFTGNQSGARIQSSIGNQSNPGIFMIIAIAILDQKYKQCHQRFDVQFSFLEYRGQKMYDLINYTQIPLQPKVRQNINNGSSSAIEFCQHRVKVCTFLQFIKLFKIALFNNKQRDIKTNKNLSSKNQQIDNAAQFTSSFIMKIRIKKYNLQSQLIYEQQTMLIDLDQNSSLRNNNAQKGQNNQTNLRQSIYQQQLNKTSTKSSQSRSLVDYILIEINNSNPFNKPIHYHMVQKNLLLQVLKKYLRQKQINNSINNSKNNNKSIVAPFLAKQEAKQYSVGGLLFIINSFTTNPFNYPQNIKFYQNLISSLGTDWQANAKSKSTFNKCFDLNYADKILQKVINALKNRKYSSLRDLYTAKQFYSIQSKKIITDIKSNKLTIFQYLSLKKNLSYNQNVFTAYQFQLIGNCIKSDNFKDFYSSKSFLALPRQIQIKTQKIKNQIVNGIQNLKQVQQKFYLLKKKQNDDKRLSKNIPTFLKSTQQISKQKTMNNSPKFQNIKTNTKSKFKLIERNDTQPIFLDYDDFQSFNNLKRYIYDYFYQIWYKSFLSQERTITQQLIFENFFDSQIRALKQRFQSFIKKIQNIEEVNIKCVDEQKLVDLDNLTQLMRSLNQAKKSILKYQPKHSGHSPFILSKTNSKKQNVYRTTSYLPKIQQNISNKKQKSISTKGIIDEKKYIQVFQIKGKIDFGSLILNPKKFT